MEAIMFVVVCVAALVIMGTYIYSLMKDKTTIASFMSMMTEMTPKIIELFNNFVAYNEDFNKEGTTIEEKVEISTVFVVENIMTTINELEISDEIKKITTAENLTPLIKPIITKLCNDLEENAVLASKVANN